MQTSLIGFESGPISHFISCLHELLVKKNNYFLSQSAIIY